RRARVFASIGPRAGGHSLNVVTRWWSRAGASRSVVRVWYFGAPWLPGAVLRLGTAPAKGAVPCWTTPGSLAPARPYLLGDPEHDSPLPTLARLPARPRRRGPRLLRACAPRGHRARPPRPVRLRGLRRP